MLQFVAAGLSLAQGFYGKKSAKDQGRQQARAIRAMADYNAKVKEMQTRSTLQAMKAETARAYKAKRKGMSSQRAAFSKTGVANKGTSLSVLIDQATEMELSIQNQRRNRLLEAQTLKQEAKSIRYKGKIDAQLTMSNAKAAGRKALLAGFTNAALSLATPMGRPPQSQASSFNTTGLNLDSIGYKGLSYNPVSSVDTYISGLNSQFPSVFTPFNATPAPSLEIPNFSIQ